MRMPLSFGYFYLEQLLESNFNFNWGFTVTWGVRKNAREFRVSTGNYLEAYFHRIEAATRNEIVGSLFLFAT